MPTTVISFTHDKLGAELGNIVRLATLPASAARAACLGIAALFERIAAGMEPGTVEIQLGATAGASGTGTLTLSSASGTVGATIAGTAVTVTYATSDANTAALLAAAINAHATVGKLVRATVAGAVVTLTSLSKSAAGSQITVVASGTGVTASGLTSTKLTGGAGQDVVPVTFTRT